MDRRDFLSCAGALILLAAQRRQAGAEGSPYAWRNLPLGGGGFVDGLAFHPKERGLLHTRSDAGGAYRWNEAARARQPLLDHLGRADADLRSVLSPALDPDDPQRMYPACGCGTAQWSRQGALLAAAGRGSGEWMQVNPRQGVVLLLGTSRDGMMRSPKRGRSLARLPGLPGKHVPLVLIDPASGGDGGASEQVPQRASIPGNGRDFGYGRLDVDARGRIVVSTVEPWGDREASLSVDGSAHRTALSAHSQHDAPPRPWLANLLQGHEAMGLPSADIKLDPHDPQRAVRSGALPALAADPLEHGTGYPAAQGRGVIVGKAVA